MEIKHGESAGEFYADTPEGKALLHYEKEGEHLNFHHTFVPPALRGRGIGEEIVAAGFEFAKEKGFKVIPSCPYVARLVMKNEEWKSLVARS